MSNTNSPKIIIIGSGTIATTLAQQINEKEIFGKVIGFIDEDRGKEIVTKKTTIPIVGSISEIPTLFKSIKSDSIIIALEKNDKSKTKEIFYNLKKAGITDIRILPDAARLDESETAHLIQTREIEMEDLLGRDQIKICLKKSLGYLRGKRVLITGAGGSIGREISRQLLYGGAQRLYLLDHSENNVYEIDQELRLLQEEGIGEKAIIVPIIGELQDENYLDFLLKRLKADVIFHTAAYKHVPLMEENPVEVVKNNLFGTYFLTKAAHKNGVKRVVLISTDKAVEPTSIYGITKLLAEQIILSYAKKSKNRFMVVRFGNVLGSRGSIVPLFKKQIEKGGPVTLTDENIDRFFMTIPEASSLVLKATGTGENGELYILDMGEPIKIIDLANQMIKFYGFEPNKEIKIETIGLRKGEKMHERLWETSQKIVKTDTKKINRLLSPLREDINIKTLIKYLYPICYAKKGHKSSYRNRLKMKQIFSKMFNNIEFSNKEPKY